MQEPPEFQAGQPVQIVSGPFSDFIGTITQVQPTVRRVVVLLTVFGRETEVTVSSDDVRGTPS